MNTPLKLTVAAAALVGLGASTLSLAPAASAQARPFPPVVRQFRGGERHPEIMRALRNLQRTEFDLRHASSDFGGHKEKAADLCHAAQVQLQIALRYDHN